MSSPWIDTDPVKLKLGWAFSLAQVVSVVIVLGWLKRSGVI